MCIMCKDELGAVHHYLIRCKALGEVRQPIMDSILRYDECFKQTSVETETLVPVNL